MWMSLITIVYVSMYCWAGNWISGEIFDAAIITIIKHTIIPAALAANALPILNIAYAIIKVPKN
jgi:hypothetical protein